VLSLRAPVVSVDRLESHLHDPSLRIAAERWALAGLP
jgi:hypothetical protein